MNDYSFLKPGLRWARQKIGLNKNERTAWCIIEISGNFPFLDWETVYETDGTSPYDGPSMNVENWEFGQEIQIPDDRIFELPTVKLDGSE